MAWPSDLVRTKNWGSEILTDSDLEGQFDLIITWLMASLNASTGHTHSGSGNNGPKLSIASALTVASQAQGDIIYASSASAWARLGAGTSGQFLKTQGAAANPIWADVVAAATQAEQETGTSTTTYVSPGRQHFHASAAKAWAFFDGTAGTPAISTGYNMDSSVTDGGAGIYTVSLTTDLSSVNYAVVFGSLRTEASNVPNVACASDRAAGTFIIRVVAASSDTPEDGIVSFAVYGDI